jgi:hypothetical protein
MALSQNNKKHRENPKTIILRLISLTVQSPVVLHVPPALKGKKKKDEVLVLN